MLGRWTGVSDSGLNLEPMVREKKNRKAKEIYRRQASSMIAYVDAVGWTFSIPLSMIS